MSDCEYFFYDESWDGEDEVIFNTCSHPSLDGDPCPYWGETEDCPLMREDDE